MNSKLNDPFGRVSKRNRHDYESLRDRFRQEDIRDVQAVERVADNFFPQIRAVLAILNLLALLWISVAYFKTRMHLKRYIREECKDTPATSP